MFQNISGTSLVIIGVIILSSVRSSGGAWRKRDVIYTILGALAFGISTTFRKTGLMAVQIPILAAAVTVGTAFFLLLAIIQMQGGLRELKLSRQSGGWFFAAAVVNTGAILSVFSAPTSAMLSKSNP